MRRRTLVLGGLVACVPLSCRRAQAAGSPVVLELFTSQGCSSCPPADTFLGELAKQPGVIALAWHVDYWNSLGWRDPFASRQWTDRQRAYADHLGDEVYTPALVVNGSVMVVGSDRSAVKQAIQRAAPPPLAVSLRRTATGLEASVGEVPDRSAAALVVYDPERSTAIEAGENSGRRLIEYRIVRETHALDLTDQPMKLPSVPPNQGVVLLVRDAAWRVIGAADLPPV